MGFRRLCHAAVVVALLVPAMAVGQTPADVIGQRVVGLRFEVEGRVDTTPTLVELSAVRVGEPLRREDTRATIARLDGLGRYEGIAVDALPVEGGVEVIFRLTPRHPITSLDIVGNTGIPASTLRRLLQQRYGGVPTSARISAVESVTAQFLRDEGYLDARVTGRTELTHDPDAASLILDIEAGPQAAIRSVDVRGVSPLSVEEVVRRSRTGVGQPYRPRQIEAALTEIEEDLRRRGHYEAQLTMQVSVEALDGVAILIGVDAGPRVEVRVTPQGALPGRVDELIPLRAAGSADEDLLEDSRARIERALRAQGYWRARAPFTRSTEQNGALLVITFTIDRGPRYYVERIDLPEGTSMPAADIRELIGMRPGDVFDEDRFLVGLSRVVDAYRRAGHYAVRAEPTYEDVAGGSASRASVILHPTITEGPAGILEAVNFSLAGTPLVSEATLLDVMTSRVGQPYVEQEAARDLSAMRALYLDRGFPSAAVAVDPVFSEDGRSVTLNVQASEGTRVLIGDISVVGNERIATRVILDELRLTPGQPAGTTALDEARRRLIDMGVFRRITLSVADRAPGESIGHVIVNVVEAPPTAAGIAAGLEASRYTRGFTDRLEFAPRGSFEISRRSLGGRNRTISFFSRVSLRRDDPDPEDAADPDASGDTLGFTEYRVAGTFQERHAFRSDTDLLLGLASEQGHRTNFNFIRQRANAEALRQLGDDLSVSGRYALEFTRLSNLRISESDRPLIDRLFPQVRLSMLSSGISWDRRDNPIDPTRGTFVTADIEAAARTIGSQVGYLKAFFQTSVFRGVDAGARTVVAGRAMMGLARGFERVVEVVDPVTGLVTQAAVEDLPASQRFFGGGATTVRGFQLDRLGVEEILTPEGLSRGGNGIVVLNVEVRRILTRLYGRDLGVVAFLDGGNVFARATDVDFTRLRAAPGFGLRYDSPLGPLRLDFGFKIRPKTFDGRRENGWEYHLSIGEAF